MRLLGESIGVPIKVYGPDTHITNIVPLALGIGHAQECTSDGTRVPPATPENDHCQYKDWIQALAQFFLAANGPRQKIALST